MTHRVLTYSEGTIAQLGVEPGHRYTVEGNPRDDGLGQVGLGIRYEVLGALRSFPLVHPDTSDLQPGDTLEFQAAIQSLRLSDAKRAELGLELGQKFVVKRDNDKSPGGIRTLHRSQRRKSVSLESQKHL